MNNMIHMHTGIRGEYDIAVGKFDSDGVFHPRVEHKKIKNLITNSGMDGFGTVAINQWMGCCRVGTGNTAPANTDTALVAQVAVLSSGSDLGFAWDTTNTKVAVKTKTFTFAIGQATGVLAEIGLSQTTGGNLFTRSLLKDSGGSTITVTVLADEQLIVTYRMFFEAIETDSVLNVTQKAINFTLTMRPAGLSTSFSDHAAYDKRIGVVASDTAGTSIYLIGISGASSGIQLVTQRPTGTQTNIYEGGGGGNATTTTFAAYTNGNYYRDITVAVGLNALNQANTGAVELQGYPFRWQVGISPRLNKTSSELCSFTVRSSWARA